VHTWDDVLSIALGARWPTTTGKPLQNNTYMILSCNEKGEPKYIARGEGWLGAASMLKNV
jgi:hypothetical protein